MFRKMASPRRTFLIFAIISLAACTSSHSPNDETPSPSGGSDREPRIVGIVKFEGKRIPECTVVPVDADRAHCGEKRSKDDRVIDPATRGIRYVLIWLEGESLKGWKGAEPGRIVLDNRDCRFEPHAAVATTGTLLEIRNSDEVLHTAHAYFAESFNLALPGKGASVTRTLNLPGLIQIRCDQHGWMNAFILVDSHPFHAVTDERGRFEIRGVPSGRYKIKAWHETFGEREADVSLEPGRSERLDFEFK
jgi:plastocyanin